MNARGDFKLSRSMNVRQEMYWMNLTQAEYLAIRENQVKAYAEGSEVPELPAFVTNEADIRQEVRAEGGGYSSISSQHAMVIPASVVVATDGKLARPVLKREKTITGPMHSIDLLASIENATEMTPERWTDDLFISYKQRCHTESTINPFRPQRQKVECVSSPLFIESTQERAKEEEEEGKGK